MNSKNQNKDNAIECNSQLFTDTNLQKVQFDIEEAIKEIKNTFEKATNIIGMINIVALPSSEDFKDADTYKTINLIWNYAHPTNSKDHLNEQAEYFDFEVQDTYKIIELLRALNLFTYDKYNDSIELLERACIVSLARLKIDKFGLLESEDLAILSNKDISEIEKLIDQNIIKKYDKLDLGRDHVIANEALLYLKSINIEPFSSYDYDEYMIDMENMIQSYYSA